jgi:hypothetical protein
VTTRDHRFFAGTDGAETKFKRTAGDPYVVPLANVASVWVEKGGKKATIVASEPPPAKLYTEIRSTLAAVGVTEHYRLVRASDGTIAAEKLPAQ